VLLETREADERAVEEKRLATRHTAMENREAQVARQKLEEELSSVRAALLTSLRYLKSFGDIPATVDAMLTPSTKARMVDTNHVHEGVQTKSTNEIATDVGT